MVEKAHALEAARPAEATEQKVVGIQSVFWIASLHPEAQLGSAPNRVAMDKSVAPKKSAAQALLELFATKRMVSIAFCDYHISSRDLRSFQGECFLGSPLQENCTAGSDRGG